MNNYYQAVGEAVQQNESVNELSAKSTLLKNEAIDRKKEALMGFGAPLLENSIVDNVRNLTTIGGKKLEGKGLLPSGTTENLGKIANDYQEGGVGRVIQNQFTTFNDGQDNIQPLTVKPLDKGDLISLDDMSPVRDTPPSTTSFGKASSNIMSSEGESPFSSPSTIERTITKKVGSNLETDMGDIGAGLKAGLKTDAEMGGAENPVGDLISLAVGLGTSIGGTFGIKHKEAQPQTENYLNPSFQLGT